MIDHFKKSLFKYTYMYVFIHHNSPSSSMNNVILADQ